MREFLDLRRRFGMEIANLLLALYNRYGTAVARRFYRRVADKDDLLDVLSVVESYLDRFEPEARRTLANYVLSILYESGVELIHEISREKLRGPRGSYGHRGWLGPAQSLGGAETLATIPALTASSHIPPGDRALLGIEDPLVRVSVGLEGPEDLIEDFSRALSSSS